MLLLMTGVSHRAAVRLYRYGCMRHRSRCHLSGWCLLIADHGLMLLLIREIVICRNDDLHTADRDWLGTHGDR